MKWEFQEFGEHTLRVENLGKWVWELGKFAEGKVEGR